MLLQKVLSMFTFRRLMLIVLFQEDEDADEAMDQDDEPQMQVVLHEVNSSGDILRLTSNDI